MVMMKKIRIAGFLSVLALVFILAACAPAVTETAAPVEETAAPAEPEEPTAEPTVAAEPTSTETPTEVTSVIQEVRFEPNTLVGGSVEVELSGTNVRWILPGPRELDPDIFGTPDLPLGFEHDIGVPLEARLTNEDGTAYTTTAGPTPFSDNFADIEGSFDLLVVDVTALDGMESQDQVSLTTSFVGPNGKEYSITVDRVIPVGPDHPFLGGVGTNFIQHGATGIGTKLSPQVFSYVAFWGIGELSVDGEVVASNRVVHGMLTNVVRNENGELVFDEEVDNNNVQFHLMLPNTEVTPDGPQESPVPTGFELPNGAEQPFLHIMFDDVDVAPAILLNNE